MNEFDCGHLDCYKLRFNSRDKTQTPVNNLGNFKLFRFNFRSISNREIRFGLDNHPEFIHEKKIDTGGFFFLQLFVWREGGGGLLLLFYIRSD